jgi:hypothetical protein
MKVKAGIDRRTNTVDKGGHSLEARCNKSHNGFFGALKILSKKLPSMVPL